MATKTSRGVALIPLTITYGVDRSDVTIPQSIPLVELLPGMVETVGAFTDQPTNDGFSVRTASGRLLDQSKSLSAQGVRAGAALTLEPLGEGAADMVYDDLTEAVGQIIERVSTPWTRDDAHILAALSAAALIFVAALLLATTPPDALASLDPQRITLLNRVYGVIGIIAALLVTGTSAVVTRQSPRPSGIALAHTVPLLTCASALRLTQSQWDTAGWIWIGVGLLVGSLAILTLPKRYRISIVAPLVLGTVIATTGLLVSLGSLSQVGVSAALFAFIVVLLQIADCPGTHSRAHPRREHDRADSRPNDHRPGRHFLRLRRRLARGRGVGSDFPRGLVDERARHPFSAPPVDPRLPRIDLPDPPNPLDSLARGGPPRCSHGSGDDPDHREPRHPRGTNDAGMGGPHSDCGGPRARHHERRRASCASAPDATRRHYLGAVTVCPDSPGRLHVGLSYADQ